MTQKPAGQAIVGCLRGVLMVYGTEALWIGVSREWLRALSMNGPLNKVEGAWPCYDHLVCITQNPFSNSSVKASQGLM